MHFGNAISGVLLFEQECLNIMKINGKFRTQNLCQHLYEVISVPLQFVS